MTHKHQVLVDTSVMIDLLRGSEQVLQYLAELKQKAKLVVSVVTVGELYQGARNKSELRVIDSVLTGFYVQHLSLGVQKQSLIFLKSYALSHGLHVLDALLAATAQKHNLKLLTYNLKHFKPIPQLTVSTPDKPML